MLQYILRRVLMMIPTLFAISLLSFLIIQLPPGDFLTSYAAQLREKGGEFGATTGRPRRCGWLDAVAVRHSARICGVDSIALTKLDVLGGRRRIRICTAYRLDGRETETFPADARELARAEPCYQDFGGWTQDIGKVQRFEDLPANAIRYVEAIERILGVPVSSIGVGSDRGQIIRRDAAGSPSVPRVS